MNALSRPTFTSPAAQRIREAERRYVKSLSLPPPPRPQIWPPAAEGIVPPPSTGPLYEGVPDRPEATQSIIPEWWSTEEMPRYPSISHVQKIVCEELGIRHLDLISQRRTRTLARPRQIAMYLCRMLTPRSLPEIGRRFGGRDHTTVMHGVRKVEQLMAEDPDFAATVAAIRSRFVEPAE
jgi:hypothetical protein